MKRSKKYYNDSLFSYELTAKEAKFCDALLAGATQCDAVIQAGYSSKSPQTQAFRLMKIPGVRKYIEEHEKAIIDKRRKETEVDDIWVTQQLKEVYNRCMEGELKMRYDKEAGELVPVTDEAGNNVWEFDSTGAINALVNLGKHIGYFEADNRQKQTIIKVNIQRNTQINNFNNDDDQIEEGE